MERPGYWHRTRSRVSRRSFLASGAAGGIGALGLGLVGCGDDEGDETSSAGQELPTAAPTPTAAANIKRGGRLKMSPLVATDDVFDPHVSVNIAGLFWNMVGDQALRYEPDLSKIKGELVEKWEVPGDGTELLFTIRPGVKWHNRPPSNGRAFTAEDLAFNLMRITGKLNPDKVGQFSRRSSLPNLDKAVAVDDKVVKVTLTAPSSSFFAGLTDFRNTLVPKDYVEGGGDFLKATSVIGTGAWIVDSWDITTRGALRRNPEYWDKEKIYLDGLDMIAFPDRLSYQAAFSKGDVDLFESPSKAERESLKKLVNNSREEKWVQHLWYSFRFNSLRPAPFTDLRVRKALSLVLDYKAMCDSAYGDGYWTYTGPLSVFPEAISSDEIGKLPGYNPATRDADRKTALDLLSAAGFPKGAGIEFKIMPFSAADTQSVRALDDLKQAFSDLKVELDIPADGVTFNRRMVSGDFDLIAFNLGGASDPVLELESQYASTGSRNYQKLKDTRVDTLVASAAKELNATKRKETLVELQRHLIDVASLVKFALPSAVVWYHPSVKGAEKYGDRSHTGSYDTRYNLKNVWIDKA